MRGVMLVFLPNAREPEVRTFSHAPDLGDLRAAIGGGWIEIVPQFKTIEYDGAVRPCIAFCDEESKLNYRTSGKSDCAPDPENQWATILWDSALRRAGHPGLITPTGAVADYLSGRVCVLTGDEQFLQSL